MINISFVVDKDKKTVAIGEYIFSKNFFQELIEYVWRVVIPAGKMR